MKRASLIVIFCMFASACGSDSKVDNEKERAQVCAEPENPYAKGTGHYAGYEWAEEHGGNCTARSSSFNEGCEEYEEQEAQYEDCQSKRR
jgi:hypothetical protein